MSEKPAKNHPAGEELQEAGHARLIREMFSTITAGYDFLNHLLSLRRDTAWRRSASRRMGFSPTFRLLDVATGTGDLGIQALQDHPGIRVVGLDPVPEMLQIARAKVSRKGMSSRMDLLVGDALALPFEDESFDAASVAFGIRNILNRRAALEEMVRVVVPGGRVVVLEMSLPESPLFRALFRLYLRWILPWLARLFSPNPGAYQYLARSIMDFPAPGVFADLMRTAGMDRVDIYPLSFGITYLHVGRKPLQAAGGAGLNHNLTGP